MRSTRAFAFRVLVLVASSFGVIPRAAATGQDLFGVGAKSASMAQTGAASGDAHAAAHLNPALLGGQERNSFVLGFRSSTFELEYRARTSGRMQEQHAGLTAGLVAPLPFGSVLEDRLALGMSIYSPRNNVARAELWFPERPQFPLLSSQSDSLGLSLGLGARLPYGLAVGVGLRWLAGLGGSVVASSDEEQMQTYTTMNTELKASLAPVVGATYEPVEGYHLGLVWRDELESKLDVVVRLADLGTLVLPPMHLAGMAQYEPEQFELEAAYEGESVSVVVGARYRVWSQFPGHLAETVRCPANGPCGTEPVPDPQYEDTVSPRVALAYRLPLARAATGEVRGGVGYEPTPVPEQVGEANTWDNARVVLSAGYGVRLETDHNAFSCDLALQTQRLVERRHEKQAGVSSDNAGFPVAKTSGHIDVVLLEIGVEF